MRVIRKVLAALCLLLALQSAAATIHRSFVTREVGFGRTEGAAIPVDAKVDKAIYEARLKEAEKPRVIVGRVTSVSDGDTIHVVTGSNVKYKVRLDRIDAPEKDQPYGKESSDYLAKQIRHETVRVEWRKKDQYGRILGIVFLDKKDINLQMVASGNAWHYSYFDDTPEYAAAEVEARQKKVGLWAADEPINPYQWRKNKRKM